jgi:hypothetical protein
MYYALTVRCESPAYALHFVLQVKRVTKQLAILQPRAQGGDEHARLAVIDLLHCRDLINRGLDRGASKLLAQCLCSPAKVPLRSGSSIAPLRGDGLLKASPKPFASAAEAAAQPAAATDLVAPAPTAQKCPPALHAPGFRTAASKGDLPAGAWAALTLGKESAAQVKPAAAGEWAAPAATGAFDIGAEDPFRADWPHW